MTEKEQEILIKILPQLNSFVNHLWETGNPNLGIKLDKITSELLDILDDSND
jgi:hypothetical protein